MLGSKDGYWPAEPSIANDVGTKAGSNVEANQWLPRNRKAKTRNGLERYEDPTDDDWSAPDEPKHPQLR